METATPVLLTEPPNLAYGDYMVDTLSGLKIPKRYDQNLRWRKEIIRAAAGSETTRRQLRAACARSPLYWLNAFGWTYRPKKVNEHGVEIALTGAASHVPFITWPVQDEALLTLKGCIEKGKDALVNKSRDMGASWLGLALFQWFFQFRGSTTFLELSRKEVLVDRRGSMDSLFEKHRYLMNWQPDWLRPNIRDTRMHIENTDNGSVIDGESTNENAGQASRSTAILLDEFARMANGAEIDLATADTTACRIFNSTPGSPTSQFTKIYQQKRAVIIDLPWWRHPEKGKGSHQVIDPDNGKVIWTSPWREMQKERRSKRDLAQNIDMEHGRVGDMIFDADEIEKHRKLFARDPDLTGTLKFDEDLGDVSKLKLLRKLYRGDKEAMKTVFFSGEGATLPWRLYTDLIEGRPPQDDQYVFGVDISAGTGSSNSVVTVKSHKSGRIVGKFWDSYTTPEDLADAVVFAAAWFGGVKLPFIAFEKNGPGLQFGKKIVELKYPRLYYQRADGTRTEDKGKRWGWHSSPQRKELLVGEYREALKTGKVINPCHEALDEALEYTFDDSGRVVPGAAGKDDGGAKATHGDHVIADALTVLGSADLPSWSDEEQEKNKSAPFGSFEELRRQARKKQRDKDNAWKP